MKAMTAHGEREGVQVGARLRAARQERRYSLDQLAQLTGMTKGFLSRVERDLTSPSVATLVSLCQVLQIDIGTLFAPPAVNLVRLEEAPLVDLGGTGIEERLVAGRGERGLQMTRVVLQPGGNGGELYSFDVGLKVWHVVEGSVDVFFSDGTFSLAAGDTLTARGREPHSWRNTHDGETVVLFVAVA